MRGEFVAFATPGNGNGTGNPNNGNNGNGNDGTQGNAGGNNDGNNGNGNGTGNPNNGNNGQGNNGSQGNAGGVNGGNNGNGTGNPNNGNNGNGGTQGNVGGNTGGSGGTGTSGGSSGTGGTSSSRSNNPYTRHRQMRSHNGLYQIIVAGSVRGIGQATVRDDTVSFSITVTAPDGTPGTFDATSLIIEGPYFSGQATVLGQPVVVHGRLDAPKSSRLVATYRGEGLQSGRVVGTLPGDASQDRWDQE